MQSIRPLITVFFLVALSACKLEINTPTSGSVTTHSTNISCAAGQSCSVDVSDIFFDETFVAAPEDGFVFTGWKLKPRGLCGGNTDDCPLYTSGFAGNAFLTAILNDPLEVFYLEPGFQSTGFNVLGIGHSFFRPFIDGMPGHAAESGLTHHTQTRFMAGGQNGAPQAFWLDTTGQRDAIQDVLDTGEIELFVMTYHPAYPTTQGYINWIDYALAKNPDTRFALALPWLTDPGDNDATTYSNTWHLAHTSLWHSLIDTLRGLYPGVEFYCIPYGQSAAELRLLFADDNLDDVNSLVSDSGDGIYSDNFGHADDILEDLGRLVWLNAIYGIELTTYAHNPGYNADLKAIAQGIMDGHDPDYNAPYR